MTFTRIAFPAFLMLVSVELISLFNTQGIAKQPPPKTDETDAANKDYSEQLPRIAPSTTKQALKSFQLEPGFRVELVAAEPLVTDPVAITFDENGVMFVAEMRGYSEDGGENLGQIRRLVDTDNDGRYDTSTVFVEGLSWPTAVTCWDGGVIVGAAPNIYFCKDTNGDGKADVNEIVFRGFRRSNVQGLLNTFKWSFDNRICGQTSSSGAAVFAMRHKQAAPLSLNRRDFAIEPRGMTISALSGGGQHGQTFDEYGRRFVCSNSNHLQMIMYEDRYIARNPYMSAPAANISIAADGPQAPVFRASPVEPWRIVRTRLRVKGLVPGPVEGGGTPAGYFTGATGVTVYRGNAFPEKYQGSVFVADCGSNLVHRKRLQPDGLAMKGVRVDEKREFLASRDIWFRPVQMANAPDGTLYVLDMSREVIEHPKSLPPAIKRHVDLTSGRSRGRIYRILPEGYQQPAAPKLGSMTTQQLVDTLAHDNGWHRETAARLLYQRQDRAAIKHLNTVVAESAIANARIRALHALNGLNALTEETLLIGLNDSHARVREHAVRCAEHLVNDAPLVAQQLFSMTDDADARARYQLAFTLGEVQHPRRLRALADLLRRDAENPWTRMAAQSSLAKGAGRVLSMLLEDEEFRAQPKNRTVLSVLATQIGTQNDAAELAALLRSLPELKEKDGKLHQQIVVDVVKNSGKNRSEVAALLDSGSKGASSDLLDGIVQKAASNAIDANVPIAARVEATHSLTLGSYQDVKDVITALIDNRQPQQLQLAALNSLTEFTDPTVAELILKRFQHLSPTVRSRALDVLLLRTPWTRLMLDATSAGQFQAADIDASRLEILRRHPQADIRKLASEVLKTTTSTDRDKVIAKYKEAVSMSGDADAGRKVFRRVCAVCHRLEGHGFEIGKDLRAISNRRRDEILQSILDPNREVDPKYLAYVVQTKDGRILTGLIKSETATSITLTYASDRSHTVLRSDIEEMQGSRISVMPEGFEKHIEPRAMADLIAYLRSLN